MRGLASHPPVVQWFSIEHNIKTIPGHISITDMTVGEVATFYARNPQNNYGRKTFDKQYAQLMNDFRPFSLAHLRGHCNKHKYRYTIHKHTMTVRIPGYFTGHFEVTYRPQDNYITITPLTLCGITYCFPADCMEEFWRKCRKYSEVHKLFKQSFYSRTIIG